MLIVFDIGGTNTRIASAARSNALDDIEIFATPQEYAQGLAQLVRAALARKREVLEGVVIGTPGVLSLDRRRLVHAPNLPRWNNAALAADLEAALGAPVTLENDAALVGLGEAAFGAGAGAEIVAYVTISTGVNGARIINGAIDRARYGFEIGEQFLGAGPSAPTLEDLVSGQAVGARFGRPAATLGKDHPVWEELALIAAIGLHNAIAHWSPDRIVIGGSMMKDVGIPIERIGAHLSNLRRKNPALPEIVRASLGDLGGLWGGLARLRTP